MAEPNWQSSQGLLICLKREARAGSGPSRSNRNWQIAISQTQPNEQRWMNTDIYLFLPGCAVGETLSQAGNRADTGMGGELAAVTLITAVSVTTRDHTLVAVALPARSGAPLREFIMWPKVLGSIAMLLFVI
jgi:hypothetical protein